MKIGTSYTNPIRVTCPANLTLPARPPRHIATVDGSRHGLQFFSTHDEWKRVFAKQKYQRNFSKHSPIKKKPLSMADAMMLSRAASRSGNIKRAAVMEMVKGVLLDNSNHWKKATRCYANAAKLFRQSGNFINEATACNYAAVSCYDAGDYEKCILFSRKQRKLATTLSSKENAAVAGEHFCTALSMEGLAERKMGNHELAKKCHLKILGYAQRDDAAGDDSSARIGAESLANGHLALDLLSSMTKGFGQINKMKNTITKIETGFENHLNLTIDNISGSAANEPEVTLQSKNNLGMLSLAKGEYSMAKSFSLQALNQAKALDDTPQSESIKCFFAISKGQLRLEALMSKMKEMKCNSITSSPLALRDMVRAARYGTLNLETEHEQEQPYDFGKDEIVYVSH